MKTIKKLSLLFFGLIVFSLVLASCGEETNDTYKYVSYSTGECAKILFTCGQNEAPFSNSVGCGCKLDQTVEDNTYLRSLDSVVERFLRGKILEPVAGGTIQGEYSLLGAKEEGKFLKYDTYAIVQEFILKDGKINYGPKKEGIIQLKIEQTNKNYIIRDYVVYSLDSITDSQKTGLSEDVQKWLADKKQVENLTFRLGIAVKQDAAIAFGRTMDDFVDSTQQSQTQQTTQQTGTQQ